jgi:mutator protein MutT
MKNTTLLFLLQNNHILLAMKKRGFGVGRWNGVGGKIETGESIEQAAARECLEEIGVSPGQLERVAHLTFTFPDDTTNVLTHVFITRDWQGNPVETEEMAPQWFHHASIPYDTMWPDDQLWLPHILSGRKIIASFSFDQNEQMLPDASHIAIVDKVA